MKRKAKTIKRPGSTEKVFKNEQLFLRLFVKSDFAKAILNFWDKFDHTPKKFIYSNSIKNLRKVRALNKIMRAKREKFFLSLSKQDRQALVQSVQQILNDFNLGQEWFVTLSDFLINGYLMPPSIDLHYQIEERNGRRVGIIEVGPETSLDDFRDLMTDIKDTQTFLYPEYQRHNLNKKFPKHFNIFIDYVGKKNGLVQDAVEYKNYKQKDIDLIPEIFSDEKDESKESDRKRLSRLRQIKHRLKNP